MNEPAENSEETAPRSIRGRPFPAGGPSANPGGRPKGIARKIREVAGNDDGEAFARMVVSAALTGYMTYVTQDENGQQLVQRERIKPQERLRAWELAAERGWGKPPQFAPIEDEDPLDLLARETADIAAQFDARMDELAARRSAHEEAA